MITLYRKEVGASTGTPIQEFPDRESAVAFLKTELQRFSKWELNEVQAKWWARNEESGPNVEFWIG